MLNGTDNAEFLRGTSAADLISGNAGNDGVAGFSGDDVLLGGSGHDVLYGGLGRDVLTGGSENDAFFFNTTLNKSTNVDRIVDFKVNADAIQLENALFTKLGNTGALNNAFLTIGDRAKDTNDYLVYNQTTGALYYDADGSGIGEAVQFAALDNKASLTANDFHVI
ncbi:hypothetical protein MAE02_71520 [Microvirga aerophila]|uniref:Calcium-binding protein n=1 Tax=Microvirga aerophila TaxID=670291 RepID=A0A512C5F3_9HYPH|nr:hypothetical protein MAE02_71520 [Microvirga aerophila]